MKFRSADSSKPEAPHLDRRKLYELTIAGGAAFWATNFAISLTPIAAEYRAALSISYFPMILQSLFGGLIIGSIVSFIMLRFFDKVPAKDPILKSVMLSFIALIIVTILFQGPAGLLTPNDGLRYFLIGTSFNVVRILALGVAIGYLFKRMQFALSTGGQGGVGGSSIQNGQ
ncbi:MAG TPA: hypothetical protein PKM11_06875 [Methanomassiliicoccales archaeon]|nr:hypothetical protein [Methanomassiliicoccales archaeon]